MYRVNYLQIKVVHCSQTPVHQLESETTT
uniref:Uncharacterized protein n=1 Tax=Anguilla anguilla TaxID=7936 RepID=A0A0E9TBA0_ANGAN